MTREKWTPLPLPEASTEKPTAPTKAASRNPTLQAPGAPPAPPTTASATPAEPLSSTQSIQAAQPQRQGHRLKARYVWYHPHTKNPLAAIAVSGELVIYDPVYAAQNPDQLDAWVKTAAGAMSSRL